jgi:hypothetical protein
VVGANLVSLLHQVLAVALDELVEVRSLESGILQLSLALYLLVEEPEMIQIVVRHRTILNVLICNTFDFIYLTELFNKEQ